MEENTGVAGPLAAFGGTWIVLAGAAAALLIIGAIVFIALQGPGMPAPPTALAYNLTGTTVKLLWVASPSTDVLGYNIYRSTAQGSLGARLNSLPVAATNYSNSPGPGIFYYAVRTVSKSGNEEQNLDQLKVVVPATAQFRPRDLSIKINRDAAFSNNTAVTLTLFATDAADCSYSNEDKNWSAWGAYAASKQWTLPSANGNRTVYYRCRNTIGNSDDASDTIMLDTVAPVVSFSHTLSNRTISINVSANDNLDALLDCQALAQNQIVDTFTSVQRTRTMTLPVGNYNFTITCRDDAGNIGTVSRALIVWDNNTSTQNRTVTVKINNGESYTYSRTVDINVSASWAAECRYSNDDRTWSDWDIYRPVKTWQLSEYHETKTVYVNCMSSDGRTTGLGSDTIDYRDSSGGGGGGAPSNLSISINNGDPYTQSLGLRLTLYARNAAECRYQPEAYGWTDWENYTTSRSISLLSTARDGPKTVYYECRNGGGTSSQVSDTISLDVQAPTAISDLSSAIAHASGTSGQTISIVTLHWSVPSDAGSSVASYKIFRSTDSGMTYALLATISSASYSDSSVANGMTYYYKVASRDRNSHESQASNIVHISTPVCDNDGICDAGEDSLNCPSDCGGGNPPNQQ